MAKPTGSHATLRVWPRTGKIYGIVGGVFDFLEAALNFIVDHIQVKRGTNTMQHNVNEGMKRPSGSNGSRNLKVSIEVRLSTLYQSWCRIESIAGITEVVWNVF